MTNGNDVARAKHLESAAVSTKRYILNEILDLSEAVAAEFAALGVEAETSNFATEAQLIEAFEDGWAANDSLPAESHFHYLLEKIFGFDNGVDDAMKNIFTEG